MTSHENIAASEHFTEALARIVCTDCGDQFPDLSQVCVFIPNALAVRQLRIQLLQTAQQSVIGPYIGSMQQWIKQHIALDTPDITPINQQARRLILIDALNQHPELFGGASSWQVCDSLLALFDELTQYNADLLDASLESWTEYLKQAYGLPTDSAKLSHEARIVQTLWRAWHEQMQAMRISDACNGYQQRLCSTSTRIENHRFYIVGAEQLTGLEKAWCQNLSSSNTVITVEQVLQQDTANPAAALYHHVYDQQQSLLQRVDSARAHSDMAAAAQGLSLFAATSAEQQAAAIDMQTRRWLLDGHTSIAIVSEDRKLARRVRALLERSGIMVQDTAGWSLSTTSAATCIERWLECIEEDFAYQPLLDLLKSPFFIDDKERQQHLNNVYRLEQDIIHHENIPGDISRYQAALTHRHKRLEHWESTTYQHISSMLDKLKQQAAGLLNLYRYDEPRAANRYLSALLQSLQQLGIQQRLGDDLAGMRILQVLQNMQHSLEIADPQMHWSDFRTWLASSLEQEQFTPQDQPSSVYLMNMQQAQYCRFDALIIAAANRASLPGDSSQTPFFNQKVKKSLGLNNWSDDKQAAFALFRSFLHSAGAILISYAAEQNGEWIQPSPWVSALHDFHKLTFDRDLHENWLSHYFNNAGNRPADDSPVNLEKNPGTSLAEELVPDQFSASRYQRVINCPYLFFAADGLSLKPEESISQELLKSEYGEKVHLILYAFHTAVNKLPPPFTERVTENNRQPALQHLIRLSQAVFETDIEDNVQHRGWLQRWLQTAEAYIDWLIARGKDWSIHQLEQNLETDIDNKTSIKGRLDRIDVNNNTYSIIDYKTGSTPTQNKVNTGEDVQLVSYAKLLDNVREVAYLKLDKGEVKISSSLQDEQLEEIKQQSLQRLQVISEAIRQGHKLHAWGDRDSCRYCDMAGLCRKQIWENL